jgi:mannose-6-phosphate isomerase-like protein (cupin superfamily)
MMMDGDRGVAAGLVHAGEGRSIWVVGDTYTFKATAESTGGMLALMEASIPPGSGPPPHVHTNEDEAFYLLAGVLDISAGEETFAARAGDFVFLPRGTPHCFTNPGVDAARAPTR